MALESIGSALVHDNYVEDIHVSEKDKEGEGYLKDSTNYWINQLAHEKKDIVRYRNYYEGKRNDDEFKYITENFGVGTPSKLRFTNLIKPRIDANLGILLNEVFNFKATCTDDKTIDLIQEEKKNKRVTEVDAALRAFSKTIESAAANEKEQAPTYSEFNSVMDKIHDKFSDNFISDFEIAAQNVLTFFSQDDKLDIKQKLKQLSLDLFITGECHWRVYCDHVGSDPVFDIIKPENIFYNKNTNSQYTDLCDAIVHREYPTRKEVLKLYGHMMTQDQKEYLFGHEARLVTARSVSNGAMMDSIYNDPEITKSQKSFSDLDTIEVYHVEWKALNKVALTDEDKEDLSATERKNEVKKYGWREDRYEAIRIAGAVFVGAGKSKHISRSQSHPFRCGFSYGSVIYNDRNGKPYSHVGSVIDLQNIYDLTNLYRDTLVANSGGPGDRINIAAIPKDLGDDFMERLMKFIAIKKNGYELIDPTEYGANLFNSYGSYDNSVSAQSLQAIGLMLENLERQMDINMGTNQNMLGQIAERDAVGNVKQGIRQTLLINEDILELARTAYRKMLTAGLQVSQVSYSKGKRISYIAGTESYVFQILPDNFCFSDYNIHVTYASKDEVKLQELKMVAKELISTNLLDPDVMVSILLSDSITEVERMIKKATYKKKQENDQAQQMGSQIEQLEQQLQEAQQQLNQSQQQLKSNENKNISLREKELSIKETSEASKAESDKIKNENTRSFNDEKLKLDQERVKLEREQLYMDPTGNSAEIKNS